MKKQSVIFLILISLGTSIFWVRVIMNYYQGDIFLIQRNPEKDNHSRLTAYEHHITEGDKAMKYFLSKSTDNNEVDLNYAIYRANLAISHYDKALQISRENPQLQNPFPKLQNSYDTLHGLKKMAHNSKR